MSATSVSPFSRSVPSASDSSTVATICCLPCGIVSLQMAVRHCAAADLARGIVGQRISYLLKKQCKNCKSSGYRVVNKKHKQTPKQKTTSVFASRRLSKRQKKSIIWVDFLRSSVLPVSLLLSRSLAKMPHYDTVYAPKNERTELLFLPANEENGLHNVVDGIRWRCEIKRRLCRWPKFNQIPAFCRPR